MRRRSVVGPLILISIGALFLLRNFIPDVPVFDLLGKWWPAILIVWGFLRLLEILFSALQGNPLPRIGISGGEWILVILLCLVGSGANVARGHFQFWPNQRAWRGLVVNMGDSFDYGLTPATQACAKNCRVVIESFRGNAKIVGVDTTQVEVSGRKSIRAFRKNEADQADTQTGLQLVAQGDQVLVRTNQDRVSDNMLVNDDLEIRVPTGSTIEAHGRVGDFDIQDIHGDVEVTSDNAGIRLDKITGNVRVDTRKSDVIRASSVQGSVEMKGRGQDVDLSDITGPVTVSGTYVGLIQLHNLAQHLRYEDPQVSLNLEKIPGQLRMSLSELTADDVVGPVKMTARSRDVHFTNFTQSLDLNLDRGDIELQPGKTVPAMQVRIARSGDIELGLQTGAKFELDGRAERGDVHNDFNDGLTSHEAGRGAVMEGKVGGGGPEVRLVTARGSVTVRKAEEVKAAENHPAPAPPAKPKSSKAPVRIEDQ